MKPSARKGAKAGLACAFVALLAAALPALAYLTATSGMESAFKVGTPVSGPFAVYSADDASLTFYDRDAVPSEGDSFEGKVATRVFAGVDRTDATAEAPEVPWGTSEVRSSVASVTVADPISPASTAYWFAGMEALEVADLGLLGTSAISSAESMFADCPALTTIFVSEAWEIPATASTASMFAGCTSLVGGSGTEHSDGMIDGEGANVDVESSSGYLTPKVQILYKDTDGTLLADVSLYRYGMLAMLYTADGFIGWATAPDATMPDFLPGEPIMYDQEAPFATIILYPVISVEPEAYAALYGSNTLVMGRGDVVPTSFDGLTLSESWRGIETDAYGTGYKDTPVPWASYRSAIQRACIIDEVHPVSTAYWFYNFTNANFTTIEGLALIDTSGCKNMAFTFRGYGSHLKSLDLSSWDTSACESMRAMFDSCSLLEDVGDISGWDTSKVSDFTNMFYSCCSLTSLDLSSWDLSSALKIESMFQYCDHLTSIGDTSGWRAPMIAVARGAFHSSAIRELDLSGLDLTTADQGIMLSSMRYLERITLPSSFWFSEGRLLDPSPAYIPGADGKWYIDGEGSGYTGEEMEAYTFERYGKGGAPVTWQAYKTQAEEPAYAAIYGTTRYNYALVFGRGSEAPESYNGLALTASWSGIEEDVYASSAAVPWASYAANIHDVAFLDEVHPTSIAYWFYDFTNVMTNTTIEGLTNLKMDRCTSMQFAFGKYKCRDGEEIEAWSSTADTSNITNMNGAFYQFGSAAYCGLSNVIVADWDTSNVTNMAAMFSGCAQRSNFQEFHAENWDTSNVTNMASMFYGANVLRYHISGWDVSNVVTMNGMFWGGAKGADALDGIEAWDTSSCVNMTKMLYGNTTLAIDLSAWRVPNVTAHDSFSDATTVTEPIWAA